MCQHRHRGIAESLGKIVQVFFSSSEMSHTFFPIVVKVIFGFLG